MSFPKLDVLLSPVEFELLPGRDLSATCCVVFDVLRATSTMTVALANGATGILPTLRPTLLFLTKCAKY